MYNPITKKGVACKRWTRNDISTHLQHVIQAKDKGIKIVIKGPRKPDELTGNQNSKVTNHNAEVTVSAKKGHSTRTRHIGIPCHRATRVSSSVKAGVTFPVARFKTALKTGKHA